MPSSGCWSPPLRTTRSSCSIPRGTCARGTPAPSGSRATAPRRSSASTSPRSTRPRTSRATGRPHELRRARDDGRFEDEGWRVRKDGAALLGERRHHRPARRRRPADRLRQGHPRPHRASRARGAAAAERRALRACWSRACTDYAIFMLDPDGHVATLERRRGAHQGLHGRGDHRPALLGLLPARGAMARGWPEHELEAARARGPLRGRGLARAQGRHALLGQRRHHGAARRRTAASLGFAKITRDLTERRAARGAAARRARSASACSRGRAGLRDLHARPRGPRDELERGRRSASRATAPTRSSASHSRVFYPPEDAAAGQPAGGAARRAARTAAPRTKGWRVRKDGTRFWARRRGHRAARRRRARCAASPRSRATSRERKRMEDARGGGAARDRVPRDARARAAQPARADPQRGRHPRGEPGCRRRRSHGAAT